MHLTEDDFRRLADEIEEQGGEYVDDTCHGEEVTYKTEEGLKKTYYTQGCNEFTVFEIPYDPNDTVLVPEPVLEVDPKREEWLDSDGTMQPPTRTKMEKVMVNGREVRRPLVTIVERKGERDSAELYRLRVCVDDDNVGMWPRFRHVVKDQDSK